MMSTERAYPLRVKLGRTQCELLSALPSNSDIARCIRHVSKVPTAEVSGTCAQATFFDHKNARKLGVKPQPEVGKSGMSYVKI
jgi:hypothetical protein